MTQPQHSNVSPTILKQITNPGVKTVATPLRYCTVVSTFSRILHELSERIDWSYPRQSKIEKRSLHIHFVVKSPPEKLKSRSAVKKVTAFIVQTIQT